MSSTGTVRTAPGQQGFTLLELLVVIAVLGAVSGVAVVAVGRMSTSATDAACRADRRVLQDAQAARALIAGTAADEATLVAEGFLTGPSSMHDVVLLGDGFELVPVGRCTPTESVLAESAGEPATDAGGDERGDVGEDGRDDPSSTPDQRDVVGETDDEADRGATDAATDPRRLDAERTDAERDVAARGSRTSTCTVEQIDLNRATRDEMTKVVHVTPGRADQIIKQRPLSSLEELLWVGGLNDARVKAIIAEGLACV